MYNSAFEYTKMALNSDKQPNDSFFDRITLRRLMMQKKLLEQKQ